MPSFPAWDALRPARSGLWPLELPRADEQGCGCDPAGALPWWGDHPARGTGLWGSPPTHSHHLNLCSRVCCSPPPSPSTQTQGPSSPSPSITEDKREAPRPWTTCLWPWQPGQGLLWLGEDPSPGGHGSRVPMPPYLPHHSPPLLKLSLSMGEAEALAHHEPSSPLPLERHPHRATSRPPGLPAAQASGSGRMINEEWRSSSLQPPPTAQNLRGKNSAPNTFSRTPAVLRTQAPQAPQRILALLQV